MAHRGMLLSRALASTPSNTELAPQLSGSFLLGRSFEEFTFGPYRYPQH